MVTTSGATPEGQDKPPYFTPTDAIFVAVALIVGVLVVQLGMTTWGEGVKTETAKAEAEQVVAWLTEAGERRQAGKPVGVEACDAEAAIWKDCRDALFAKDGPFGGLSKPQEIGGALVTAACDRNQLDTLDSIIIEKGLPKPPDGASFIYGLIDDAEPMKQTLPLRVSVCGRGYSQIIVNELKF